MSKATTKPALLQLALAKRTTRLFLSSSLSMTTAIYRRDWTKSMDRRPWIKPRTTQISSTPGFQNDWPAMDVLTSSRTPWLTSQTVTMPSRKMSWDSSNATCGSVKGLELTWTNSTSPMRSRGVWPMISSLKSSRTRKVLHTTPSSHSSCRSRKRKRLRKGSLASLPEQAPQVWSFRTFQAKASKRRIRSTRTAMNLTTCTEGVFMCD